MGQMFYYINQPCIPSFPIGLTKTKYDFTVRSVETGLRGWTEVVAVISVDAYSFLAFSNLTCHLEDTRIGVFGYSVPPDSEKTELGSSNQEASPSARKNTGIVALVLCHGWNCVPTAISGVVDISEVPGCHLLQEMSSQWGSQKLLHRLVYHELIAYLSIFNLFLSQWIMAILSKGCKPDSFEPHNSLRLSFTNIQGLHSNFVECESFLDSNSPDILTGCDTSLSVYFFFLYRSASLCVVVQGFSFYFI